MTPNILKSSKDVLIPNHSVDDSLPIPNQSEADFLANYVFDPAKFSHEVLNCPYDPWQSRAAESLLANRFVSIRSGNGVGKTFLQSSLIWWFLLTRYMSKIPCTASTASQLGNILWGELSRLYLDIPYLRARARVTQDMIQVREYEKSWFAVARTAADNSGEVNEALQGFHAPYILYVVEEASGVPDKAIDALESATTNDNTYGIMCSNPTRRSGFFFKSHLPTNKIWAKIHVKPQDTERVTEHFYDRMRTKYRGENTNGYRIRVLGEFPRQSDMGLLSNDEFNDPAVQRFDIKPHDLNLPLTISCDPAGDSPESDSSTIGIRKGPYIVDIIQRDGLTLYELADEIEDIISRFRSKADEGSIIPVIVDTIGVGLGLGQELERRTQDFSQESPAPYRCFRVTVGSPPVNSEADEDDTITERQIYTNLRAQLFVHLADKIQRQEVFFLKYFDQLEEDLCEIKKEFDIRNKIKIQSKIKFRADHEGRSTNYGDAAALLFYPDLLDGPIENSPILYSGSLMRQNLNPDMLQKSRTKSFAGQEPIL